MLHKILFVDDDQKILDSFNALLRKRYLVVTAQGPEQGLDSLHKYGPFSVVVSDLKMPKIDGIQFLSKVRHIYPDAVRIILTGFADAEVAIKALNEGSIFRFLTKPCSVDTLSAAIDTGIKQYQIVTAERDILQKTLRGSVRVLIEALSLANPAAYGRTRRVRMLVHNLAKAIGQPVSLELDLASMLSHIGCMSLPRKLLRDISAGRELSQNDIRLYNTHPLIGAGFIEQIPRLKPVATIVAEQNEDFHEHQSEGAQFIKISVDYDLLISKGLPPYDAYGEMLTHKNCYSPILLDALEKCLAEEGGYALKFVTVEELEVGMVLEENIISNTGFLLVKKCTTLDETILNAIGKIFETFGIVEPIAVIMPSQDTRIDLSGAIDSLLLLFKQQMATKCIDFHFEIDKFLPKNITGKAFYIKQILFNLISNAFKFSETGQISVCVSKISNNSSNSSMKLLVVVSDSGPGIQDENIAKIFSDIYSKDDAKISRFQKKRLGLPTVKTLVNLLNGSICINSNSGIGTDVYFTVDVFSH